MSYAVCPACGEEILIEARTQVGQNMVCSRCRELLAVVTTNPLILEKYQAAINVEWYSTDKQEAYRRHERKSRHASGGMEQADGFDWKKAGKKSKKRGSYEW